MSSPQSPHHSEEFLHDIWNNILPNFYLYIDHNYPYFQIFKNEELEDLSTPHESDDKDFDDTADEDRSVDFELVSLRRGMIYEADSKIGKLHIDATIHKYLHNFYPLYFSTK